MGVTGVVVAEKISETKGAPPHPPGVVVAERQAAGRKIDAVSGRPKVTVDPVTVAGQRGALETRELQVEPRAAVEDEGVARKAGVPDHPPVRLVV